MRFVIHEHQARGHHFDFRLEVGGSLKSWAVPKGPSLHPQERRLAIQVPDHALEYGSWEGIIPEGNYGAGAVAIWDQGDYRLLEGEDPQREWENGRLTFELMGERLQGAFSLVRMRGGGMGKDWLLIKQKDAFANKRWQPTTVLTPQRLSQLKEEKPPCPVD